MVIDYANLFVKDVDLLQEISQFILVLNNRLISENENFSRTVGIDSLDDYNRLLIAECDEYKVYDC